MRATISSHIRISRNEIPPELGDAIAAKLSIRNPDKDRALSEHVYGAKEMPDEIKLWTEDTGNVYLPRGFAHSLQALAQDHGIALDWQQQMTLRPKFEHYFKTWPEVDLRGYQLQARQDMLEWASGIYMGPTGSGKTRVALEVMRLAGQPTLIIVDKTSLAKQWRTVIKESYGYDAGAIGDGVWNEAKHVTVALRQSLWSRRDEIRAEFWKRFGMVIWDEVHHVSAQTVNDLAQRFPAFYRLGYSATPVWDPLLFPMIEAVIGPIVHRTLATDVGEARINPRVVVVPTEFEREYIPTNVIGHRRISNNYNEIMAALVNDDQRNQQIVDIAFAEAAAGHHVLITTRRVEHVENLIALIACDEDPKRIRGLHVLTGKQSKIYEETRQAIAAATGGTILVSTIADEALDIPRLDRLIMAYPARRVPLVEQQIGRIVRVAEGKTDAIVYDIYDEKIGVIKSQHRERVQQLYLRRRWSMERRELAVA